MEDLNANDFIDTISEQINEKFYTQANKSIEFFHKDKEFKAAERQENGLCKFSDEDTHAIREFKTAISNRLYLKYTSALGLTSQESRNIFNYVEKNTTILHGSYVFAIREKMQPAKWYYKIDEKLPQKISFTPNKKYTLETFLESDTIGIKMLMDLKKKKGILQDLCNLYNLNYNQIKNIFYLIADPVTGVRRHKIFPQEKVILSLRDVINPDYWFIFPDEINK